MSQERKRTNILDARNHSDEEVLEFLRTGRRRPEEAPPWEKSLTAGLGNLMEKLRRVGEHFKRKPQNCPPSFTDF